MNAAADQVMDLIFGRWRSQILSAGTELGVFDRLDKRKSEDGGRRLPAELAADPTLLYRLLRAQAAIGLLEEGGSRGFVLTDKGGPAALGPPAISKADGAAGGGPAALRSLEASARHGPGRQAKCIRARVRSHGLRLCAGEPGLRRALQTGDDELLGGPVLFGSGGFARLRSSPASAHSAMWLEAMGISCARLLLANPGLHGIVLDLPEVRQDVNELWVTKLGLQQRCQYVAGDMFEAVPKADAYSLKMILHDWNDAECIEILSNIRKAATGPARVFIVEHIVPEHDVPHFSKLFDIHMMCWGTGQERTEAQYLSLLEQAGWKPTGSYYPDNRQIGVITGVRA